MLILLPPSETKRSGGDGRVLALESLSFPSLTSPRREVLASLAALGRDPAAAARALKLSPKAAEVELARNREIAHSPTMPTIERYTGVLYDALDVASLDTEARHRATQHLVVHSALFGLLRADDAIPAYRLSCTSVLPRSPLTRIWRRPIADVLAGQPGPIVDLRSAGYASLGALPETPTAVSVSVVAVGDDGVARALNHFNKKGKGEWVRAILSARAVPTSIDALFALSGELGWPLRRLDERMLELTVPGTLQ